ncbi:hypothetical protein FACS1894169_10270 [Bacteroidia bacterium]|nr:hypothetical protein FACS1894169_10270 [Bacteroidia bacterium]
MMAFVCFHQRVDAQQGIALNTKRVTFEYDKENVYVGIPLNLQDYYVELGDSLTLTPLIKSGTKILELPKLVLIGQGKQGFYLYNRNYANTKSYSHPQVSNQKNQLYKITVAYERWMDNSRLEIKVDLNKIGGVPLYKFTEVLKNSIREKVVPTKPEFLADRSSRIEGVVSTESVVFDLRHSSKKSFDIANQEEMDKIKTMLDWLMFDESVSLIGVYITAYTSIDGIYYENEELTKEQALAFKRVLQTENNYPESLFFTDWKGEDWPGLTELVRQSYMPYQQEVLNIINTVGVFTGRELKLMQLAQGNPYRYMRDNLFPQQWRIECRVVYRNK